MAPARTPATGFHDQPPAGESKYKSIINRAKAEQRTMPAPLTDTPSFERLPKAKAAPVPSASTPTPLKQISEKTTQGLQALAEATTRATERTLRESAQEEAQEEVEQQTEAETTHEDPAIVQLRQARQAVEERLQPLDIGQYLMTGIVEQTVPVVPGRLEPRFRSVTEYEEGWVDKQVAKANEEGQLSNRQFYRLLNELGLAVGLVSINGSSSGLPLHIRPNGEVDEEAMKARLATVRRQSGPIFAHLIQNMAWFVERVNNLLTVETLKNG